jgi:hypothetical protein
MDMDIDIDRSLFIDMDIVAINGDQPAEHCVRVYSKRPALYMPVQSPFTNDGRYSTFHLLCGHHSFIARAR